MPYVSVVVPTYNSALFITDTLSSIINNEFQDVEIIVVDDGSSDQTVEIVKRHPGNVKLITQQNNGRGASRNNGVRQATGRYIAFLDHDDLLTQMSIADRVAFLDSNPDIGWVFTDAIEFDHSGDLRLFLDQFPWLD
ncbi:MAG: glycosyltransferase family 2 protein, partial [Chlorobium sp.]|nr:glycosyltransferase family 2 protein [Chlorobium sp.]